MEWEWDWDISSPDIFSTQLQYQLSESEIFKWENNFSLNVAVLLASPIHKFHTAENWEWGYTTHKHKPLLVARYHGTKPAGKRQLLQSYLPSPLIMYIILHSETTVTIAAVIFTIPLIMYIILHWNFPLLRSMPRIWYRVLHTTHCDSCSNELPLKKMSAVGIWFLDYCG